MKLKVTLLCIFFILYSLTSANDDIFLNEKYTSGYIEIKNSKSIFYWHFQSRSGTDQDPLIFWFSRGFGQSSLMNIFIDNGPYQIQDDLKLQLNPFSWNNNANIVYFDSPVGSGFSFAKKEDIPTTFEEAGEDILSFISKFLDLYSHYKSKRLFLAGESFSGHYLSEVSQKILKENHEGMKLTGILLLSSWTNPLLQEKSLGDYSLEMNLINQQQYDEYQIYSTDCFNKIKNNDEYQICSDACKLSFNKLNSYFKNDTNLLNIKEACSIEKCYDFSVVEKFFKLDQVKEKLNVSGNWNLYNFDVFLRIQKQEYFDSSYKLIDALESGIKVMVVSGEYDLLTNYIGTQRWIENLNWSGADNFKKKELKSYTINKRTVGTIKSERNLSWIIVKKAGNLIQFDQPEVTQQILELLTEE